MKVKMDIQPDKIKNGYLQWKGDDLVRLFQLVELNAKPPIC